MRSPAQVIIVGDLNIAASQKDVHSKLDYNRMYSQEEKALLHSLLHDYTDIWRLRHPDETSTFTVWDEKTSARAFNEVCSIFTPQACSTAQLDGCCRPETHTIPFVIPSWACELSFRQAITLQSQCD